MGKMAITGMANGTSNGMSNSAPIKVRKNHWANGCSYQCILCKGQKYPEEFMFKKHIMTAHNMSPEEYQNNFGDPALVKQLHICKVCNRDVKHEYTAILNHLRVKHNMTLTTYADLHPPCGGGPWPPVPKFGGPPKRKGPPKIGGKRTDRRHRSVLHCLPRAWTKVNNPGV